MEMLIATILAVGPLVPLLTSVVNQPHWSSRQRTIMSVIVSIIAGTVVYTTEYGLDFSNPAMIVTAVVGVILASAASYKNIWKPAGVAPAIEIATSSKSKHHEGSEADLPAFNGVVVPQGNDAPEYSEDSELYEDYPDEDSEHLADPGHPMYEDIDNTFGDYEYDFADPSPDAEEANRF